MPDDSTAARFTEIDSICTYRRQFHVAKNFFFFFSTRVYRHGEITIIRQEIKVRARNRIEGRTTLDCVTNDDPIQYQTRKIFLISQRASSAQAQLITKLIYLSHKKKRNLLNNSVERSSKTKKFSLP